MPDRDQPQDELAVSTARVKDKPHSAQGAVPLFLFNQFGNLERVLLRRGNYPSAKFWRRVLLPVIARYRDRHIPMYFRGDSAFALPKLLRLLEKEGFRYTIRLKAKAVLERKIPPC